MQYSRHPPPNQSAATPRRQTPNRQTPRKVRTKQSRFNDLVNASTKKNAHIGRGDELNRAAFKEIGCPLKLLRRRDHIPDPQRGVRRLSRFLPSLCALAPSHGEPRREENRRPNPIPLSGWHASCCNARAYK